MSNLKLTQNQEADTVFPQEEERCVEPLSENYSNCTGELKLEFSPLDCGDIPYITPCFLSNC